MFRWTGGSRAVAKQNCNPHPLPPRNSAPPHAPTVIPSFEATTHKHKNNSRKPSKRERDSADLLRLEASCPAPLRIGDEDEGPPMGRMTVLHGNGRASKAQSRISTQGLPVPTRNSQQYSTFATPAFQSDGITSASTALVAPLHIPIHPSPADPFAEFLLEVQGVAEEPQSFPPDGPRDVQTFTFAGVSEDEWNGMLAL